MTSKMPTLETMRKHYPDCSLTDDKLMELPEWLRVELKQEHVSPINKCLKILIAWEDHKWKQK